MTTDTDQIMRALLAATALAAVLLSGSFFGAIWADRGWPIRVICVGLFTVLVYGFVGQVKAFNLDVPFDAVSCVGLVGYAVLVTGLVWFVLHEHHTRRDR